MPEPALHAFYRYYPVAERDRKWGLFATTVGEARIEPGAPYPPPGHPKGYDFRPSDGRILSDYQIVYISAGSGWVKSGSGGRASIKAGDVFLLTRDVWHSYAPSVRTGWWEAWVGFDGPMARRIMRNGFFDSARPVLRPGGEDQLLSWFKELVNVAHGNNPAIQQIMAGIILRILAHLYSSRQSKLAGDDRAHQVIRKAVSRLRESLGAAVSFDEIARELNVSYSWFRRAFAHHTGLSPHQYLLEIRLAYARNLLVGTSLPAKEIAARVGFDDPQYFCRLFHNKVGTTPSQWRKRSQKGASSNQKIH